jgi:alkylhydroperoxidase family enzyme
MIELNSAAAVPAVLAVWRVTHLLVAEDGPWNAFAHLRRAAAAVRLQRLADCFYCASVWIAVPFALLIARDWRDLAMWIPALSGGAIVLERLTAHNEPAVWTEEKEKT